MVLVFVAACCVPLCVFAFIQSHPCHPGLGWRALVLTRDSPTHHDGLPLHMTMLPATTSPGFHLAVFCGRLIDSVRVGVCIHACLAPADMLGWADCGPGDAGGVSSTSVPTLPPMRLDPVGAQRAHVLGKMLSKAVATVLRDLRIPLDVSRVGTSSHLSHYCCTCYTLTLAIVSRRNRVLAGSIDP